MIEGAMYLFVLLTLVKLLTISTNHSLKQRCSPSYMWALAIPWHIGRWVGLCCLYNFQHYFSYIVTSTPRLSGNWTHNVRGDRHWLHVVNSTTIRSRPRRPLYTYMAALLYWEKMCWSIKLVYPLYQAGKVRAGHVYVC
jgi:hypothetical protein